MSNDLYNEHLLSLAEQNAHQGSIPRPDREATKSNPLCGDRVTIQLKMNGDLIQELRYHVRGCILCKASCALLADIIQGSDENKVKTMKDKLEFFLKSYPDHVEMQKEYEIFSPVRAYKNRHNCVMLPYDAIIKSFGK